MMSLFVNQSERYDNLQFDTILQTYSNIDTSVQLCKRNKCGMSHRYVNIESVLKFEIKVLRKIDSGKLLNRL